MSSESTQLEEQKKAVVPFMQRAQELQQSQPKIAYYCRLYAVEQAMAFKNRAKEISGLVEAALTQMERDKKSGLVQLDNENDQYECESFAIKTFDKADRADRAGKHDSSTASWIASTLYASSFFFEVLNHWNPLLPELVEKQRYALWRAAELRKAVREGRPPIPAPSPNPAGELPRGPEALPPPESFPTSSAQSMDYTCPQPPPPPNELYPSADIIPPSSSYFVPPPEYRPVYHQPSAPPPAPPAAPAPPAPVYSDAKRPPVQMIVEAQKYAKHAVSSLNFDDVPAAINYLKQALSILQGS